MPNPRKNFVGKLLTVESHWTCLELPFDVEKVFGQKGRVAVRGTMNGFPYRTSIFPDGKGKHFMMVNKQMQAGAGVKPGDTMKAVIELDTAPRTVTVPAALKAALAKSKAAKAAFDKLAYSHRKRFADWTSEGKQAETRVRRAQKAVKMLLAGETMD